jgi:hypothetical protein
VDVETARVVLGVGPAASAAELRAAYRARLRAAHPDLHGGGDAGTAEVVVAFRVLRAVGPEPVPEGPIEPVPAAAVVVDGDTVTADLPAGDLFALLVEAGDALGEVSYVDAQGGLLEVVVDVPGHGACSVVLTLQTNERSEGVPGARAPASRTAMGSGGAAPEHAGRSLGHTEAWCTVEPLGGGPAPAVEVVAELLADGLRAVTGP